MSGVDPLLPFIIPIMLWILFILVFGYLVTRQRRAEQLRSLTTPAANSDRTLLMEPAARTIGAEPGDEAGLFELDREHTTWRLKFEEPHKQTPRFTVEAIVSPKLNRDRSRHGQPPYHASYNPSPETIPFSAPIILRAETNTDRLGKRLKINREHQTGHVRFDESVYIESDAPDQLIALTLQSEPLRHWVLALFSQGFNQLTLYGPDCILSLEQQPAQRETFSSSQLTKLIQTAESTLAQLPHVYIRDHELPKHRFADTGWFVLLCITGLNCLLLILSLTSYIPLSLNLLFATLAISAALWVALVPALIIFLRGRPGSFNNVIAWLVALLVALPINLYLGARTLNAVADPNPPILKKAIVQDTWLSGKRNSQCNIAFQILPERESLSFEIPCERYYRTALGNRAMLTISPGLFGQPWLKDWRNASWSTID